VVDTAVAAAHIEREARALLARLSRLTPFALHETMVPAAMPSIDAQRAFEEYLARGRRELRARVGAFLSWLLGPGMRASPPQLQRRFVFLRLRFNAVLSEFDVFANVLTQRSEHETGPWLAGLDVAASDALTVPGYIVDPPPVMCYLDRGHGAAIRRVRARLPGGGENPVAIVRIPRERMVGAGVASSLVHEVGHQAAALLDLTNSIRRVLQPVAAARSGDEALAWKLWTRWISEIVADFWALARLGVTATSGLMAIVSLPRPFVFHMAGDDPHPFPWIRSRLSCAMGAAIYPDPQWEQQADLWSAFYPLGPDLTLQQRAVIAALERTMPEFVRRLVDHRPPALNGRSLADGICSDERSPEPLRRRYRGWRDRFVVIRDEPPSLALAALGQARADGVVAPEHESRLIGDLLTYWALRRALPTTQFAVVRGADRDGDPGLRDRQRRGGRHAEGQERATAAGTIATA